jgi:hypothetical protein
VLRVEIPLATRDETRQVPIDAPSAGESGEPGP